MVMEIETASELTDLDSLGRLGRREMGRWRRLSMIIDALRKFGMTSGTMAR